MQHVASLSVSVFFCIHHLELEGRKDVATNKYFGAMFEMGVVTGMGGTLLSFCKPPS